MTDAVRVKPREARERIGTGQAGVVYVLHFSRPVVFFAGGKARMARHYIGFSRTRAMLNRRLAYHAAGQGARLTAAAAEQGITWELVAVFHGADRHFERYLHAKACTPEWCPRCCQGKALPRPHRRLRKLRTLLREALNRLTEPFEDNPKP